MRRAQLSDRAVTCLWLLGLTWVLSVTGGLSRIDHVLYDLAQQSTDRAVPDDVVLIAIDEQSLSSLGRWPWSRRLHAQLIDRLHADGAKAIGLDLIFSEPQTQDPAADVVLASAMARAGHVVLPVVIEQVRRNGQLIETLPLPSLVASAAALGRVHAELDADAIARSITLWEGLGQPTWPHFAQAMLTVAGQVPDDLPRMAPARPDLGGGTLVKHDQRYINFASAQRHLPSLSYVQVLRGEFQPGTFQGKLVLVGATASGMADSLPTPISGFQQPMPGVAFLTNAMIAMRGQNLVSRSPLWLSTVLACAVALWPMLWLPYVRTRTGLLANLAWAACVLAVAMALPVWFHVWLPLSAGLLGVLSAYPIWAWRKLESASQFLDAELSRLQQALGPAGLLESAGKRSAPQAIADRFQRRIDQVKAATAQLEHLDQSQRETLALVSHDIRVPLASAAAQIKDQLGEHHAAHKQLAKALGWTEDFLQTSRAQMLRADSFSELDVIALLHEVADDIYPLAQAKGLPLVLDLPDEPVWVLGHWDTLSRAMANLLGNALKFSPPEGAVRLAAARQGQQLHITICDQGVGIAAQDLPQLFKRFSRLGRHPSTTSTGVGLGLYFVQTTVSKHGGQVQVLSRPGQTTFSVDLPVCPEHPVTGVAT